MRENTLQLLIFSLVTFPSTEFKVKSAISKVVAMVGDRRKRVRHSALDTLAVLSQIYESEDILEASKRYTKGKQDGQTIHAAIKTRLSRKLLPTVSVDGLVVYGLQISSNSPHTGADVEWIIAGSGSVSPGTGRTRGQLIAMSKMENDTSEQNNSAKKPKSRPASEHSNTNGTMSGLLEKNERTASWKLLPQSDQNDKHSSEKKSKKINRTSKSATADFSKVNNSEFEVRKEEIIEKESQSQKPYATPKRSERKSEIQNPNNIKSPKINRNEENSNQVRDSSSAPVLERATSKLESRIPIYTGDRTKIIETEMNSDSHRGGPAEMISHKNNFQNDISESNGHSNMHQRRKRHVMKSAAPRINYAVNYPYPDNYRNSQFEKSFEEIDDEYDAKLKKDLKNSPLHDFKENQRTLSYEKLSKGFDAAAKNSRAGVRSVPHYQYSSRTIESYESIYHRQRRVKEEKSSRIFETSPSPVHYGYEYEGYNRKIQFESEKNKKDAQTDKSLHKRRVFVSPFDEHPSRNSMEIPDEAAPDYETDSNPELNRANSARTFNSSKSANPSNRTPSPRHDVDETRFNSGSSSSSNRSATSSGGRLRSRQTLPAHTESDESNGKVDGNSRTSSPCVRSEDKAFDVISTKSNLSRRLTPDASIRTESNDYLERPTSASDDHVDIPAVSQNYVTPSAIDSSSDRTSISSADINKSSRSKSAASIVPQEPSTESLGRSHTGGNGLASPARNGYGDRSPPPSEGKSRPESRSSSERAFSARANSSPARSMVESNGINDDNEDKEPSESADEEEAAFETLDFRNAAREVTNTSSVAVTSPVRSRASYEYDNELQNADSNVTLYSCNSVIMSPKSSSPKRFINDDLPSKDTDSDETPPLPIGFDGDNQVESSDGTDEIDDVGVKPQPSRLPTPIDLPRKLCKVSPCKMKSHANCNRTMTMPSHRHHDKHVDKSSKAVQQCFAELDSKDWEVTLKGLRTLSQIARDEPEQLDACAPGSVARVLGKHVKNLRSQVARVACSAAGEIFKAHIRGIDQDLDEIAGPLLHRTADTNKFLREDCNIALDSMIEHVPPHRTIITITNRGASHQNTIVHATTARLLYVIVSEIGPEYVMILPRDVKDKLFATTAKLLTDGNLQARKHAKETFRLLSRCEGFRKALTDAVPETTLRLIDKTLRSL